MKLIKTEDAVGHVLCHDLTRIVKDEFKGAQFKKGHIITEEDIPMLLSMGKEHLYVWEMEDAWSMRTMRQKDCTSSAITRI